MSTDVVSALVTAPPPLPRRPRVLFTGAVKVLLFTVIPAGFVAYIPVELLRRWDWSLALLLAGVAGGAALAARLVFDAGLRRYESGNLLAMRA